MLVEIPPPSSVPGNPSLRSSYPSPPSACLGVTLLRRPVQGKKKIATGACAYNRPAPSHLLPHYNKRRGKAEKHSCHQKKQLTRIQHRSSPHRALSLPSSPRTPICLRSDLNTQEQKQHSKDVQAIHRVRKHLSQSSAAAVLARLPLSPFRLLSLPGS